MATPAPPSYLYRCYTADNTRGLKSGKYMPDHDPMHPHLDARQLDAEFDQHMRKDEPFPTALVSTTASLLRAVHIAFGHRQSCDPDEVIIVIISPRNSFAKIHNAHDLALRAGLDLMIGKDEWVFEWHIPDEAIIHAVTLFELETRGFTLENLTGSSDHPDRLADLRKRIQELNNDAEHTINIADWSAAGACCFGLAAPLINIADEILSWTWKRGGQGSSAGVDIRSEIDYNILCHCVSQGEKRAEYEAEYRETLEHLALVEDSWADEIGNAIYTCNDSGLRQEVVRKINELYSAKQEGIEALLRQIDILSG